MQESSPMQLCIVTHNLTKGSGQGRVNYEVTWEALRRGYHVTLLASQIAPELQEQAQITWVPIVVQGIPTELLRNSIFAQKTAAWLRQHRAQFDLVKVNGGITPSPADVNAVHFVHSSWLRSPAHTAKYHRNAYGAYQWLYTRLNAHWEGQAFRRSRVVVAVSEKVKQELTTMGVPAAQIQVVLNGVDLQEFAPGTVDRHRWNLPEAVPLALFAGEIRSNRKNLDTVLQALKQVPNLHLAVVGNPEASSYPQMASQLGLADRVHFLGYRRDIAAIMQAADVFVFPSRYEACTLVLLEALAAGLPVITAVTAGGSEIVTPDCGVVLSDSEDVAGLVTALQKITPDRTLSKQMGQAARAVAERHSWAIMAQGYVDLFEKLNEQN
jgi:glycosyltransferase involved in cell wall biosynthesis